MILSLNGIDNKEIPEKYLVAKYEMLSELTLMYSGLYVKEYEIKHISQKKKESIKYSNYSIKYGHELIEILKGIERGYVIKDSKKDRALYNIATAYGILIYLGELSYNKNLNLTLNKISESFKENNPAYNNPFIESYYEK